MKEVSSSADRMSAGIITRPGIHEEQSAPRMHLEATCIRDGEIIWQDELWNTVTRQGKKEILIKTLDGGTGDTWYMGLIATNSAPLVTDVAGTHAGWTEQTTGWTGAATRKTCVFGTASDTGNDAEITITQLSWAITASITIYGAFIINHATADTATERIYSGGLFAAGRSLENNDTLQIDGTWTIT